MSGGGGEWHVSPLDSSYHQRTEFSCGAPELDRYLRDFASQDVRRNIARVFVATSPGCPVVAGYYSLNAASFRKGDLPADHARRLPHYPVPAAVLGRLATDIGQRGRGLGSFLLMDALDRVLMASRTLAVQALVVEARDGNAAGFYRRFGFLPFIEDDRRLFLPMTTIRRLIDG